MPNPFENFRTLIANTQVNVRHIIHVGAHQGQEVTFYRGLRTKHITLVEPIPEWARFLKREYLDLDVVQGACSDQPGEGKLHVLNPTLASTLVDPGPKEQVDKVVTVPVFTLEDLAQDYRVPPNIAVIDVQGKELDVLKGAKLEDLDMIVVETCTVPDPVIASNYDDVVDFLEDRGFAEHIFWSRDYGEMTEFIRGTGEVSEKEQIRDVVFVKEK